jgi:hypothetical protein
MNDTVTLRRLRTFLRALAAALFVGTVVELLLAEHTDSLLQLVPFLLCGLGLLALAAAWARPRRATVLTLRLVMVVVACGSLLGVTEHFLGNRAFARETHPRASAAGLLRPTLTGADPLLAPGILAVAAAVAAAATYGIGRDRATASAGEQAAGRMEDLAGKVG